MPSVIESPNATTACTLGRARMSTASRKNQDAVVNGNAASLSSALFEPEPGAVRYEVCRAFACQVIGPLSPGTWKLTASLRPTSAPPEGLRANGRRTASLHTERPGAIVTRFLPRKVTGWFVPATTAELVWCSPTNTSSKLTGFVPRALEKRRRASRPQISGLRIRRKD